MKSQHVPPNALWIIASFFILAILILISYAPPATETVKPEATETISAKPEATESPEMVEYEAPADRVDSPNCPAPAGYYPWGPEYEYMETEVREGGIDIVIGQSIEANPEGGGINHKITGDINIQEGSFLLNLGQNQILPLHLCNGIIWIPGEYILECNHPKGWINVGKVYTLTNNRGVDLIHLNGENWIVEFGDSVNGVMNVIPGFLEITDLPGVNEEGTVNFYLDCFGVWWMKPFTPLLTPTPAPPDGLG